MFDEKLILIAFILISVVLVAYVIVRPGVTVARGGKMLAFVALLVFPVMAGSLGTVEHLRRSTSTQFCLSCHIMVTTARAFALTIANTSRTCTTRTIWSRATTPATPATPTMRCLVMSDPKPGDSDMSM